MATVTKIDTVPATPSRVEDTESVREADQAMGASMIAAGIGSLFLGLAIIGAEANAGIKTALTLMKPVGPLSGKSVVSVIAFLLSWAILHVVMKDKNIPLRTSFIIMTVLVVLGLLLSFPPVFMAFGGG